MSLITGVHDEAFSRCPRGRDFFAAGTMAIADDNRALTGAVGGAVTGAVVGGPVGAAVGGAAGAAIGGAATETPRPVVVEPKDPRVLPQPRRRPITTRAQVARHRRLIALISLSDRKFETPPSGDAFYFRLSSLERRKSSGRLRRRTRLIRCPHPIGSLWKDPALVAGAAMLLCLGRMPIKMLADLRRRLVPQPARRRL